MKALRVHNLGEPKDVLKLEEVPVPEPAPGQIVVRVLATAVNFPDALMCRGLYQEKPPLPFTPGVEICGETADGRRVIANPALPYGGFAQYAVADAAALLPAPDSLDDAEAAALHIGYQTGWFELHRRAGLEAGETLLVLGAAGGVGIAAIEIGKVLGARVIACASTDDKLAVCREHGADEGINYTTEDLRDRIKALTGGKGVDVVYDAVGGPFTEPALRSTAWRGRLLVVGFALETEDQRFRALAKLERKSCDLMVLNGPEAMHSLENHVEIINRSGDVLATLAGPKEDVARGILAVIQRELCVSE